MGREVRRAVKGEVSPPAWTPDRIPMSVQGQDLGWQMWETTSEEGSPISPICDTPEDLARWLVENRASAFGHLGATYEQWLLLIKGTGASVGLVSVNGTLTSGVAAEADWLDTSGLAPPAGGDHG